MQRWQRWITLATLALIALGPGLFWSPSKAKAGSGLSQGWMAVPLPQPLLEAKAKCNPLGPGLVANALEPILRSHTPTLTQAPLSHPAPPPQKRLYLAYARLQTDGG
ncbi:hypothetical protein [Meiothermus ruber]|jgi:hypothetical protein|uniref:Uncharacterized protein n=1 Tax=Meiothermus ruber (strain ATCC 35948 / DSM 1279 / VKM B-1258 / 21) TaxID=504728 RepID=D3PTA8_MEIRD|nr:hypothetical protein [Meiothermus ruber]ADD28691.1 hypothetical protein Mrub_1935 [Meiothermus ruber DSM 1279]AGK05863.1 hypothetical protein K649_12885 [Meiothermus ruber DSM 1279]MCL6530983.1 hypothetical protein [Meiothermus ruber]MCX7801825.1 hypothetical protein [Meiothermus ruber]GAO75651.1 putative uncharacterized protein [Meiothermus ruber H328]